MRLKLGAGLAIVAFAGGCSSGNSVAPPSTTVSATAPTTTTSVATTTSRTPRPTKEPPITRTLDVAAYYERPCQLLTPEQQGALQVPPRTDEMAGLCEWGQRPAKNRVRAHVLIQSDYFHSVYVQANNEKPGTDELEWEIFDPLTIAGQPAVALSPDNSRATYCGVLVGTGPRESLYIQVSSDGTTGDSCARAASIAEKVIGNLVK